MKSILHIFLFLLLIGDIKSQVNEPVVKKITTSEGLCSNELYHSYQDNKGIMWFCSNYGISSYDGYNFKNYTKQDSLPDYSVLKIIGELPAGRIWFWTMNAQLFYIENEEIHLYKYQNIISSKIINGSLVNIGIMQDGTVRLGIPNSFINKPMIYEISSNGKLKEIYKTSSSYTVEVFESYIGENIFIPIHTKDTKIDSNKTVHFIFNKLNGQQLYYQHKANFFPSFFNLKFYFINEKTFIQSVEKLISITQFKEYEIKLPRFITALSKTKTNDLLVSTYGDGFYLFKDADINNVPSKHFSPHQVGLITVDKDNGYWIPTLNDGLYYWSTYNENIIKLKDKVSDLHPTCIAQHGDTVFIGTEEGKIFIHYNNSTKLYYNTPLKTYTSSIKSLWFDEDTKQLYFSDGTLESGYINENKHVKIEGIQTATSFVKSNNNILTSFFCGVAVYDAITHKRKNLINTGECVRADAFQVITSTTGILSSIDGIWTYNLIGKDTTIYYPIYKNAHPLLSKRIKFFSRLNSQYVLAATKGDGLLIIDLKNLKNVQTISLKEGLSGELINKIHYYNKEFWIASNKGISSIRFSSIKPLKYEIKNYGTEQGFPSDLVIDFCITTNHIGIITGAGFKLIPKNVLVNKINIPSVYIKEISTNNSIVKNPENVILESTSRNIEIKFTCINYKYIRFIKYRFKLEGIDEDWNYTENNFTRYTDIAPGKYKFIIEASVNGKDYNKQSVIEITKIAAFYETVWFKAMLILIILLAATLLAFILFKYWKTKAEEKLNISRKLSMLELTALRAQMNPHFLFNVIANIQTYIFKNDSKIAYKYLGTFAKLLRGVLNNSDKLDSNLMEEVSFLKNYLELERMRFSESFTYEFIIDEELYEKECRIPTFMLQPIIENSIKHGFNGINYEGHITIEIKEKEETLILKVYDNGVGLNYSIQNKENTGDHISKATSIINDRISVYNYQAGHEKISIKILDRSEIDVNLNGTIVELIIKQHE